MRFICFIVAVVALSGTGCFHGSAGQGMNLFSKAEQAMPEGVPGTPSKTQELSDKPTAQINFTMAENMEKGGQDVDAIVFYEKARTLDPALDDRASRRLAVLYDRVDEQAKAMHEFQEQLKKKPKDAALLNDMGYSLYNRAQWAEAEIYLRRAVTADKAHKSAWVNLGLTLAQQGKEQEALDAFSHAVSTAEAYSNLGFVHAVQGKKAEALAAYRKALELEPALKIAQAAVQRLEAVEAAATIVK